ncbi:hypothetical protein APHAL10511_005837 [Amanita phalloides]|nr:hypothetical protein APHAL10511_005837 [Amanita phalloides]
MSMHLADETLPSPAYDAYAHYARNLIQRELRAKRGDREDPLISSIPSLLSGPARPTGTNIKIVKPTQQNPVGILGAGAAGLYTALILESLGIPYKILEAQGDVGGRLFTYRFPDTTGAPYNYFDVGAMRFPKLEFMKRVFHLFQYPPLNTGDIQLGAKLKPFHYTSDNSFLYFNGIALRRNAIPPGDPFKASQLILDADPSQYIAAGVSSIEADVLEPFATRLLEDIKTGKTDGWDHLMKYDKYSLRSYMGIAYTPSDSIDIPKEPLSTDIINWCEMFEGLYDCALSEYVLDFMTFGSVGPQPSPIEWFSIDGGSNQIAQYMAKHIRSCHPDAIQLDSWVSSIALIGGDDSDDGQSMMEVITNDEEQHHFSHVICTIPLPVLRLIDTSCAKLSLMQMFALRTLNYGPAVKIGMQFKTAWWTTGKDKDGEPLGIVGGQSSTDRPLQIIIYPSHGDVQKGKTTTLIASYGWAREAERLSVLAENDKPRLVRLVLNDLAGIHNVSADFLRTELLDTFVWDWSSSPYSMGAYASFGPGKFKHVYTSMTTFAADGLLHFAGEALSPRHAWVEGALDSAWRAVAEMLSLMPDGDEYLAQFYSKWGYNPEWILRRPKVSIPDVPRTAGPLLEDSDLYNDPTDLNGLVVPGYEDNLILQNIRWTRPEYFEQR